MKQGDPDLRRILREAISNGLHEAGRVHGDNQAAGRARCLKLCNGTYTVLINLIQLEHTQGPDGDDDGLFDAWTRMRRDLAANLRRSKPDTWNDLFDRVADGLRAFDQVEFPTDGLDAVIASEVRKEVVALCEALFGAFYGDGLLTPVPEIGPVVEKVIEAVDPESETDAE